MTDERAARGAIGRRATRRRRPPRAARHRRPPQLSPRRGALGWRLPAIAVALAAIVTLAAIYAGDRIPRGVRSIGVSLAGLTVDQAAARLAEQWPRWTVAVSADGEVWPVPPEALGLVFDAGATARSAHARGRSPREIARALLARRAIEVPPVWHFDPPLARSNLTALVRLVDLGPRSADVRIAGGRAEATPARAGRALDSEATLALLAERGSAVVAERQFAPVTRVVPPEAGDVSELVADANRRLVRPVRVRLFDPVRGEAIDWDVPPATWSAWVAVRLDPADRSRLEWTTDVTRAEVELAGQAGRIGADRYLKTAEGAEAIARAIDDGRAAATVRVYHAERRHRVASGETVSSIAEAYGVPFPWIQQSNPGLGDAVWPGQDVTIPSPDVFLPLPVVEDKRIVVAIGQQRMWAYEDGKVRWEWPVSTGIETSPTSPGVFQVQSHEVNAYASNWDLWMPHFMGIYRPLPASAFMNGFHGFPTRGGSALLWTGSLGHPVTFGCILVASDNERLLYDWASDGVVVEIRR